MDSVGRARWWLYPTRMIHRLGIDESSMAGAVHARCCSLALGSHSAPSLERFRQLVVRIKRQIGVERP